MNLEIIKKCFFDESTFYPFSSVDFWNFFGYTRHQSFVRYLQNDDFNDDVTIRPWEKVNVRRGNVYYISRSLFHEISIKRCDIHSDITSLYLEYKKQQLKERILVFYNAKERNNVLYFKRNARLYGKYPGKLYNYSLSTYNMAMAIDVNNFDLFKFCSVKFCSKYSYVNSGFENQYSFQKGIPIPHIHFDSFLHSERWLFLVFIKEVINHYKLTDFQKKLCEIYYQIIQELIDKQVEYDIKCGRMKSGTKKEVSCKLTCEQVKEMKLLFKKNLILLSRENSLISER